MRRDPQERTAARSLGSKQADAFQVHRIKLFWPFHTDAWNSRVDLDTYPEVGSSYETFNASKYGTIDQSPGFDPPRVANETRPKNVAVNFIIKY